MNIDQDFKNELATVIDHGLALSSKKQTPYVWLEFQFNDLMGDDGQKPTARANLYLSEKALGYTLEKLSNLGWRGNEVSELNPLEPGAFNFKGRTASITGHLENYNGKSRPVVDFINDPDYSPLQSADAGTVSALDAKLRGKIAAFRAKNKQEDTSFP